MVCEHFGVCVRMGLEHAPHGRAEFGVRQRRAERAVQDLATRHRETSAVGHFRPQFQILPFEFRPVGHVGRGRSGFDRCRHVVRGLVRVVSRAAEVDNVPEQPLVVMRDNPQRFQVAGAGRLHVKPAFCRASQRRVRRELVRTGMETELVRAEQFRDGRVVPQRGFKRRDVALEIDSLFQFTDEPRRQTHQLHAALQAPIGDDVVLGERRGLAGLVDGKLDLVVPVGGLVDFANVAGQLERLLNGESILDGSPHAGFFAQLDGCAVWQRDRASPVTAIPRGVSANGGEPVSQRCFAVIIRPLVDVVRRIDGEERETGRCGDVHVFRRLEMIRVRSAPAGPACGPGAGHGFIDNLLSGTPSPCHLADRLLPKDGLDARTGPLHRLDMARRRQTDPVAEPEARSQPERGAFPLIHWFPRFIVQVWISRLASPESRSRLTAQVIVGRKV